MLDVPEGEPQERISIWTPEKEVLVAVFDRLGDVIRAFVASNGGSPPDVRPYPRPITASQLARAAANRERRERLSKRLLS